MEAVQQETGPEGSWEVLRPREASVLNPWCKADTKINFELTSLVYKLSFFPMSEKHCLVERLQESVLNTALNTDDT